MPWTLACRAERLNRSSIREILKRTTTRQGTCRAMPSSLAPTLLYLKLLQAKQAADPHTPGLHRRRRLIPA